MTMSIRTSLLRALAAGFFPLSAYATDTLDFSAVAQHAQKSVEDGSVPSLALAVAQNGNIVYEQAFGFADIAQRRAATIDTAYPLASASKPITATALMVLQERGKVDLTAPVASYLAPFELRAAEGSVDAVTLQTLLNHTSGLGTYAQIYYGDAIAARPAFAASVRRYAVLVHPPGRVSEYSNLGYGLIGNIIARRSGKSFAAFLQQTVFQPLGMRHSFIDAPSAVNADVASGYDIAMKKLPVLYNDTPGAGNAYASAHDLLRFGMFHLDPERTAHAPLKRETVERMRTNADPRALHHYYADSYYAQGWYVRPNDDGLRVAWHEGGMPGASTIIKLIPEHRIAVVVLSNRTDANELTQEIANQLLAVLLPDYKPARLDPTARYTAYAAQPEFLGHWSGSIEVEGHSLPCTLTFASDGTVRIAYADSLDAKHQSEASFGGLAYGDSFIGAFAGHLPISLVLARSDPLLLLKLIRTGSQLSGTAVAYSSPERLNYLLPFYIHLQRDAGSANSLPR